MTPQQETNLGQAMMAYDSKHGRHKSKMPPDTIGARTESEIQALILKVVGANGGCSIKFVQDTVGASHCTARNNLYILKGLGRLEITKKGRFSKWYLAGTIKA
tara:strand:- start:4977 stop:5285 length:309 start_codon:yes stop_codon:yes gene_type:complete